MNGTDQDVTGHSVPDGGHCSAPGLLSLAVVGAGPSGLYAADALLRSPVPVLVDVIDRLPSPFGLVRYGVAPDHPKIKSVDRVLARPFAAEGVRFIGNVEIGAGISHDDLARHYDAVIYATGCQDDREWELRDRGGCPVVGSGQFIGWYNGHPDAAGADFALDCDSVAIVGGGNVALDVARVLARPADELALTDVPDAVLGRLCSSRVRDIHVIVRGLPHQARFGHLELLTLDELAGVQPRVHARHGIELPADLPQDRSEAGRITRNTELLRSCCQRAGDGLPARARRRIHLHFGERVEGISRDGGQYRISLAPSGGDSRGASRGIRAGMVITAIGYRGRPIPGLPFDELNGIIPNVAGRVVRDGRVVPGTYVTGWAKRGPSGVIAAGKADAAETAAAVLEDLRAPAASGDRGRGPAAAPLPARRTRFTPPATATDWAGWLSLDAHEVAAGLARGAGRVKIARLTAMLEICRTRQPEHQLSPPG
jgi:ferredoxin--NADP+ reductase